MTVAVDWDDCGQLRFDNSPPISGQTSWSETVPNLVGFE
jgi:hypothetical protein